MRLLRQLQQHQPPEFVVFIHSDTERERIPKLLGSLLNVCISQYQISGKAFVIGKRYCSVRYSCYTGVCIEGARRVLIHPAVRENKPRKQQPETLVVKVLAVAIGEYEYIYYLFMYTCFEFDYNDFWRVLLYTQKRCAVHR